LRAAWTFRVLSRRAAPGNIVVGDLTTGWGIDAAVKGADLVIHEPRQAPTANPTERWSGAGPDG
jgi:hypothetical protein